MSAEGFVPGGNQVVATFGNAIPSQGTQVAAEDPGGLAAPLLVDASGYLEVNAKVSVLPTGAATSANQALQLAQETAAAASVASLDTKTVHVDTGAVVISSSALPAGASTAALQTSGNASLTSIDGKTPALGQAVAGSSVPVVLPSAQIALLQAPVLQTGANVIGSLVANQSVNVAQFNGVTPLMGAGNSGTGAQRVTISTDQLPVATKAPVNPSGSYAEKTNLTNSAQTFTAPANAVGFLLEADDANTANVRWKQGAAATTSSGMKLQPGRDSGYIPCAADISVIGDTAATNQIVTVQWVLSV